MGFYYNRWSANEWENSPCISFSQTALWIGCSTVEKAPSTAIFPPHFASFPMRRRGRVSGSKVSNKFLSQQLGRVFSFPLPSLAVYYRESMFSHFDGQYRSRPRVSLRGASKQASRTSFPTTDALLIFVFWVKEAKDTLLQRAHLEREQREVRVLYM